jgi:two-component system, NarL family, response regulator NreC
MRKIKIVLADDHRLVRQSLRSFLESVSAFTVIGEAGNGLETLARIEEQQPDVLILDLIMPGLSGLEVVREVTQRFPQIRILVLTMYEDEPYVQAAFKQGALGYVLKGEDAGVLIQAIHFVADGWYYLSPQLARPDTTEHTPQSESVPPNPYERLTPREREVFGLVTEGFMNSEIASRLSISRRTVEHHRANLMRKLGVHSQAELIRYALRLGITR